MKRENEILETAPVATPAEPRLVHSEASQAITSGANDCADCGQPPLGMMHDENSVKPFEVGCVVCRDHRARANSAAEAVAKWNAREFLSPKQA